MSKDVDLNYCESICVWYSDVDPDLPEYRPFTFTWFHIPTSRTGNRTIWCNNERDFLKVLDMWNYWGTVIPNPQWIYFSARV